MALPTLRYVNETPHPTRKVTLRVGEQQGSGTAHFGDRNGIAFVPDVPTLEPAVPERAGELIWTCGGGLVHLPVVVAVEDHWDVVCFATGDLSVEQRREHVRVDQQLPVMLRRRDGRMLKALALDYSGGGLRLELGDGEHDLGPGATAELSVKLNDFSNVEGTAAVVRAPESGVRACAFIQIREP